MRQYWLPSLLSDEVPQPEATHSACVCSARILLRSATPRAATDVVNVGIRMRQVRVGYDANCTARQDGFKHARTIFEPSTPGPKKWLARPSWLCLRPFLVLRGCLTSEARASAASVCRLPAALQLHSLAGRPGGILGSPVHVRGVSVHAQGFRPRAVPVQLALALDRMLPSATSHPTPPPQRVGRYLPSSPETLRRQIMASCHDGTTLACRVDRDHS
jgi:hypothetical protein